MRLAVVIRRMVEAHVAGVMFTADPVTGRRGQIVIDAAPGLGESVVSGAVNPDHFVIAPELPSDADLRAIVAGRREEYARELRRKRPPRVLLSEAPRPRPRTSPRPTGRRPARPPRRVW